MSETQLSKSNGIRYTDEEDYKEQLEELMHPSIKAREPPLLELVDDEEIDKPKPRFPFY